MYNKNSTISLNSNRGIVRILLRNLLVNAIKFSNKQSKVEINVVKRDHVTSVEVIDQGIGMTEEMQESIFTGGLTSTDGTDGEKGNGLGLALCFDFVKGLGGKMEVESRVGKGSVFRVILNDQPSDK